MDLLTISFTLIAGALCIYLFLTRNYNHFKKFGIPFVKPTPIFGNMTDVILMRKSMPDVLQKSYDCHPDAKYVGLFDCTVPVILLKDPELIKSVTIKNFDSFPNHRFFTVSPSEPIFEKNLLALKDEAWRDMRTVLSPAFSGSKMKMMFKMLSECAVNFSDHLTGQNPQPDELNMKELFGRYTLDVIATAAFGLNVDSMKDRNNDFYRIGKSVADFSGFKIVKVFILKSLPWLAKLFDIRFMDHKTTDFFTNVIESTITARDAQGIVRPDMIHLMMQARDRKEKSSLSIMDMTAQAFIFLLGGYEAPSSTMCFAAHLLALNPDIQKKLQTEIDQVIEQSSDEITYEDLHAMKYLDAVVNETLRLFPPNPATDRIGPKSFTLPPALPGLKSLQINPGQNIWIPIWSIHRDPKYFPNPEKFDPERFNEDNKSKIIPMTYIPFGFGPRTCIANRFALMEVKLVLFHLLAKCTFLPSPKTTTSMKLSATSFGTMLDGGIWLKIKPRK